MFGYSSWGLSDWLLTNRVTLHAREASPLARNNSMHVIYNKRYPRESSPFGIHPETTTSLFSIRSSDRFFLRSRYALTCIMNTYYFDMYYKPVVLTCII